MSVIIDDINRDISYFGLGIDGGNTPLPILSEFSEFNLFKVNLVTGDLSPNDFGDFDDFFELNENGDITPKILVEDGNT